MASWYDEWLLPNEKHKQISSKAATARRRIYAHNDNVERAQKQTAEREAKQGEAYARKMQKDTNRSREILNNAFLQKTRKDYNRNKR